MGRSIAVITLLALAGAPAAQAADFDWIDDSPVPPAITASDPLHRPWQLAADRPTDDQVMNTTLTVLHKLARNGLKYRRLAGEKDRAAGFAGTSLRVSGKKLRLQFRFRF